MSAQSTAAANKELVLSWFRAGPSSEAGRAMLAADFVWHIPKGMAGLVNDGVADLRGPDALLSLSGMDHAVYAGGETTFEMVFCIAEDDFVALQANIGARSYEGDDYRNTYVFSFRCDHGKIAEVWEIVDTKYWCDTIIGRPEQLAGVQQRLAEQRAVRSGAGGA